jgi:soluble lytic murein transglycosylase-like protein
MPENPLIAKAKATAVKYGLNPAVFCALVEQESGWNTWALRYEPGFLEHYVKQMPVSETEKISRSTSYGLCQVMGQVAREHSFTGKYLTQLCDPDVGLEYGAKVLSDKMKGRSVEDGLLRYNGGGNKKYPSEVLARMVRYQ